MKVIVGLTSIRARAETLHLTLGSLLAQDYRDFEVRVHVSPEPYLLDEGIAAVPEACRPLLADPRLSWAVTRNLGPYRKLLPMLAAEGLRNVMLASADDDTIYPPHWLGALMTAWRRHRCVIAFRGHAMARGDRGFLGYRSFMGRTLADNPSLFWLPTGKDGVLYNAAYFHPNVLNHVDAMALAPTADDLWFKWHTAAAGVPVHVINPDYASQTLATIPAAGGAETSLFKAYNETGGNDAVLAALEAYGRERLGFAFPAAP